MTDRLGAAMDILEEAADEAERDEVVYKIRNTQQLLQAELDESED